MFPIQGSDIREIARGLESIANEKRRQNELKENELKARTREVFALEKANELKEIELNDKRNLKQAELEIYNREVSAMEKRNEIELYMPK